MSPVGGAAAAPNPLDVLLVSLGSTAGLRASDDELAASIERAGANVVIARSRAPAREWPTFALTDLAWARAARAASIDALASHAPRAIIYSTITAALLAPRRGAIRFDALSAANRPGRHGVWQRPLERRRLREAPLLVPVSEAALAGAPQAHAPVLVVPIPVDPSGPRGERDIAAISYVANPRKKGLDRVLAAWSLARRDGEELLLAGVDGLAVREPGVRVLGRLERDAYRALLRRARVYVTAPRREDHGIAQLEALADGALLVSTPAPGSYPALAIARELDPRLIGDDLARAIRTALDDPLPGYEARAAAALAAHSTAAVDRVVAGELLTALGLR
jgi:hypothetical protein